MTATTAAGARADHRGLRVQGMPAGRWVRTTPGRLRVWSIGVVLGLVVVGTVVGVATEARGNAARSVASADSPELVASESLYGYLANADATASIIFLQAGREAPNLRQRYESDIEQAGQTLARVTQHAGAGPDGAAARDISSHLAVYAGYVEAARANGRFGYPVGAAYLRQASSLMRGELLPDAVTVYEQAAARLSRAYQSGTAPTEIVLTAIAGGLVVALLVGVQLLVARRSKRVFNFGLVAATVVVLALLAWALAHLASTQGALVDARQKGSDPVQLLSAARILTLEAQSDDNTALIERGTGQAYVADFDSVVRRLQGPDGNGGLLSGTRAVAARTHSTDAVDRISSDFSALLAVHAEVRRDDASNSYNDAVVIATTGEADAVTRLDAAIGSEIASAQKRLDASAKAAQSGFGTLAAGVPVLTLLAALLVPIGMQRRIAEYR